MMKYIKALAKLILKEELTEKDNYIDELIEEIRLKNEKREKIIN